MANDINKIKKVGNKLIEVDWNNIDNKPEIHSIYMQEDEPTDALEGSIWIDIDDILGTLPKAEEGEF